MYSKITEICYARVTYEYFGNDDNHFRDNLQFPNLCTHLHPFYPPLFSFSLPFSVSLFLSEP